MNRNRNNWLILTVVLVIFSLWIDLSQTIKITNPLNGNLLASRNVDIRLGLDLRGGLQTLMEADVPADVPVSANELEVARQILENRANALGVSEVVMQTAGDRRIVAEFPGISNPEEVISSLQQTGLLEFVDMGNTPVPDGTEVKTDYVQQQAVVPPHKPQQQRQRLQPLSPPQPLKQTQRHRQRLRLLQPHLNRSITQ